VRETLTVDLVRPDQVGIRQPRHHLDQVALFFHLGDEAAYPLQQRETSLKVAEVVSSIHENMEHESMQIRWQFDITPRRIAIGTENTIVSLHFDSQYGFTGSSALSTNRM
jgi:hypothetical protein